MVSNIPQYSFTERDNLLTSQTMFTVSVKPCHEASGGVKGYASLGYTVSADQDATLGSEIIYDQNTFQERFLQDSANAKESVVIVSHFVTVRRVRWIEGALARCVQKRVKASVVTRDPTTLPAKARGAAQTAIQTLRAKASRSYAEKASTRNTPSWTAASCGMAASTSSASARPRRASCGWSAAASRGRFWA